MRLRTTLVVGAVVTLAWLWLFRGPLFQGEVCALRDAGNFYYPLFSWQCSEWSAGRIPLWNPLDGLGASVVADGTSSVFYPGKLLFLLPVSFDLRFNLYLAGHVLLAAWSVYFIARQWRASEYAAGVAAVSYACGGYVLFQYCNVVYLVSAAWLPLAVWLVDRTLVQRKVASAMQLGGTLALMTLGGDPQTAVHVGLAAVVYGAVLWRAERRGKKTTPNEKEPIIRGGNARPSISTTRPALLAIAAATACCAALIQVWPTFQVIRGSERAEKPFARRITDSLAAPRAGTHAARTYEFSIGPWRLAETIWPNFSGQPFPVHHRWASAIPAEGEYWTPSLYAGLIPWLAALFGWRSFRSEPRTRWLVWLVLLGVVGSFGWFGVGWLIHEVRVAMTGSPAAAPWLGQPVGGVYWLFATLIPGYAYFRYPAKWFVLAALGCSLLAARGVDRMLAEPAVTRRLMKGVCAAAVIACLALIASRSVLLGWIPGMSASGLYGSLDVAGAWQDVFSGAVQVAVVSAVVWRIVLRESAPAGGDGPRLRLRVKRAAHLSPGAALLWLTAADLVIANHWLIATVPSSQMVAASRAVDAIRSDQPAPRDTPPVRVLHPTEPPDPGFGERASHDRLAQILAWERNWLLRRHHLLMGLAVLDAPLSVPSAQWSEFVRAARSARQPPNLSSHSTIADLLGVNDWIGPTADSHGKSKTWIEVNPRAWPRAWLEPDDLSEPEPQSPFSLRSLPRPSDLLPGEDGNCRIVSYQPQRVEFEVRLTRAARLVLSDTYDADWRASYRDRPSQVEQSLIISRAYGLLRTVTLPPGEHQVVFEYSKLPIGCSGAITLASWLLLATISWRSRSRESQQKRRAL